MPLTINTSNYINTQTAGTGNGQIVSGSSAMGSDGAVISVKGLDLQAGQTISGQVVEVDGKDIKLLLSNNQMVNAKLEGNINALLGQTLSFEVKLTDNGQTALRPLYTNLNSSPAVSNALSSAGLPQTENYIKMVSSMMDEGMPVNKEALYSMSKQMNSFPLANPETIVQLTKLGLEVNELTINQYENYKGFEHQVINDVDSLSKGLTDLMKDSLMEITDQANVSGAVPENEQAAAKPNLFSAFLSAISGNKTDQLQDNPSQIVEAEDGADNKQEALAAQQEIISGEEESEEARISPKAFDTAKLIMDMVDTEGRNESGVPDSIKGLISELNESVREAASDAIRKASLEDTTQASVAKTADLYKNGVSEGAKAVSDKAVISDVLDFAKGLVNDITENPDKYPDSVKKKLALLLSDKSFSESLKDGISRQMLLKPEDVVSNKNIEEMYSRITKNVNQALEILASSGKDNPEMTAAAKNISDNVSFMNELNQVVTYVQLPLLMNNKSAHGDLYVYTNKKSLKNNDGNISALLHLDMENLGPMDVYVALSQGKKLNTHFYFADEETIDFMAEHIDVLNKRLTAKGYDTNFDISVKDNSKGRTDISKEFMKDDPSEEGVKVSKFSFDVRA